jgi:hypothetical protein
MPRTTAVERTFEEAVLTAKESKGVIHYDAASFNPTFTYADDDDRLHEVWMLDATTAFNQLAIVGNLGAKGIGLWRLGSEDPSIWTFFGKNVALDARRRLRDPPVQADRPRGAGRGGGVAGGPRSTDSHGFRRFTQKVPIHRFTRIHADSTSETT